jgi:protein involved in polysaccharide export with SLBB domain
MKRLLFCLSILLLVLAASAQQTAPATPSTPQAALMTRSGTAYILTANDVVHIRVFQEDDLETRARVSKDGTITVPLIGAITIAGKTIEQAAALIREELDRDYLVNPQVTVSVFEYSKRRFTVLGQVNKPQTYEIPFEETITLQQAIAMAGGYTRLGSPSKITVERMVNGKKEIHRIDAEKRAREKDAADFEILPDDVIKVGEKLF